MRDLFKSFLLFEMMFFSFVISSQTKQEKKLIKQQLEDFTVFKTSLFEIEAKIDRHFPKDSLNFYLDKLEDSLRNYIFYPKTIFKNYAFIISKIQSGHASVIPSKAVLGQWVGEANSLPMDVILHGKKLYVVKDYNMLSEEEMKKLSSKEKEQYQINQYTEITSIDGLSIAEWMNKVASYLSSDENGQEFKYYQAKHLFEFYRSLVVQERKDSIEIRVVLKRDTISRFLKSGQPPTDDISERYKELEKQDKKNEKDIGTFEFLSSKYAYFKFVSFQKCEGKKYTEFLRSSFEKIANKKVENVIIDLRGNTGGIMQYQFLEYFKPVKKQSYMGMYDVIQKDKPTYHRYLEKNKYLRRNNRLKRRINRVEKKFDRNFTGEIHQENLAIKENTFEGNIIVITNEATFSAAAVLTADLRNIYGAKIIGTRAGGSFFDGTSGIKSLKLPNSKNKIILNPNYYHSSYNHYSKDEKTPEVELLEEYGDPKKTKAENEKNLKKALKALGRVR